MTKQMELGLGQPLGFRRGMRRQRRLTRARWWFAQMRQVVSNAAEPESANATPSKQIPSASPPFDLN